MVKLKNGVLFPGFCFIETKTICDLLDNNSIIEGHTKALRNNFGGLVICYGEPSATRT